MLNRRVRWAFVVAILPLVNGCCYWWGSGPCGCNRFRANYVPYYGGYPQCDGCTAFKPYEPTYPVQAPPGGPMLNAVPTTNPGSGTGGDGKQIPIIQSQNTQPRPYGR